MTIFGKAIKTSPNQTDFVTPGQEKEFGPEDRRKLTPGQTGKLRWHKTRGKIEDGRRGMVDVKGKMEDVKPVIKDRNKVQLEILTLAEIPEEKISDYALDSYADGQKLGEYAEKVMDGSISREEAARRVKEDYSKMASGQKEAPNVQEKVKQKWYRGINSRNENEIDKFYSGSKEVVGNFAIDKISDEPRFEKLNENNMPKNPLKAGNKDELAAKIGFAEDPYSVRKFDDIAKKYAQKKGHDAIIYESGTFDEPELHIFGKENKREKSHSIKAFGRTLILNLKKGKKPLMKGEQVNMFGSGSYSREGETRPGKGGTLKLTRDKTGKGAHWNLLDKKEGSGRGKGSGEEEAPIGNKPLVQNKVINNAQAYDMLSDKLGNKAIVMDKKGNPIDEGKFNLINENSDGTTTIFFKDKNGQSKTISVPANQAVMHKGDSVVFQFADRDIAVSLNEKAEDQQNINPASEQREAEKQQEWDRMADNYIREAKAQLNPFLQDLDEISKENELEEMSHTYHSKAVKKKESIINKFERNEAKGRSYKNNELSDTLRGTIVIKNPGQYDAIMKSLDKRGYRVWKDDIVNLFEDKKPGYKHIAVKLWKGEGDSVIKELMLITPKMYEAKKGFGHDVYDIEKNIDIMLGSKINENHKLYPELIKYKQAMKDITNRFYMRAYKADMSSSGLDSDASSSAEPETSTSKSSRKDSFGYSAPPKRMIRSLRSSLKTLLQFASASLTNSSGDMFNLADSSEAINSTLGSIINPTKNVMKMFASKVVNLYKSNKQNVIIQEGSKMNIFKIFGKSKGGKQSVIIQEGNKMKKIKFFGKSIGKKHDDDSIEIDLVAQENEGAGGVPQDQLPEGTKVSGFNSQPYCVNYQLNKKHIHIWQDTEDINCFYVHKSNDKESNKPVSYSMESNKVESLKEANEIVLKFLK